MSLFDDVINKKKKEWDAPTMMDGAEADRGPKLAFSSPLMNYATYGGIPRDKITEFFGEPGCGKSSTAIDICKNAIEVFQEEHEQKLLELREDTSGNKSVKMQIADLEDSGPRRVLYIDLEHSFDRAWAETLGIDHTDIELMQPPDVSAEKILQTVQELIETNEVGLIVLDSIPSLVTQSELEKKFGERTVASLAGLMTVFMRKVIPLLTRYHTSLILINQVRDNMDNPYVTNTPGGKAIKFYSCLRIQFTMGNPIDAMGNEVPKNTEDPAGYVIKARIVKQKSAPNDRKNASYYLVCRSGIRPDMDYAQLAIKSYGFIKKSGGWFTLCDPETGEILEVDGKPLKIQGMPRVYEYLEENPDYYHALTSFIERDINGLEEDTVEEFVEEEVDDVSDDQTESAV